MKKIISILILISCLIQPEINGQKLDIGAFAGANINFLGLRSEYAMNTDEEFKPGISCNFGGYLATINKGMFGMIGTIEYLRIRNKEKNGYNLTDVNGDNAGSMDKSIINHYLTLSVIGKMQFSNGLYLGLGLSGNILLKSIFKTSEDLISYNSLDEKNYGNKFTNYHYKKFLFSIPVIVGFNHNRFDYFIRFNKGIMNRLNNGSYIKEYENTLILGIGYRFAKI